MARGHLRRVEVAAVKHGAVAQERRHARKVRHAKGFPFGDDGQRIRALQRLQRAGAQAQVGPLAVNLMVSCRIAGVRMESTVRWVGPMLLAMFLVMVAVIAFPQLALWLPAQLGY